MARIKPTPQPKPIFPQFKFEKAGANEAGWWHSIRTSLPDAIRKLGERWWQQEVPEGFYQRSGTTVITKSNLVRDTKPVFPQFVLVEPESKTSWWNWDSIRHSFHDAIHKINEQWHHKDVEEKHDQLWSLPSNIPKCHLNCIFEQAMHRGCSYSDLFCICYQVDQDMLAFELCTKDCRDNQIERFAPGAILDFCDSQNIALDLPGFMKPYQHLNRRQSEIFSSAIVFQTTNTVTTTTSLPYGDDLFTYYTSGENNALTITEVIGVPDTEILYTDSVTTTLPSGAEPFTSTFTNLETPEITVLVGIPTNSQGKSQPTQSQSTGSPTTTPSHSHGLSNGAKIGIGVAVPLVVLVLVGICLIFSLRRQKAAPGAPGGPQQREIDDGGLPENIASISELPKHPSYILPVSTPASGNDWNPPKDTPYVGPNAPHELNAKEGPYHPDATEIGGNPRHEIEGPLHTGHGLTSSSSLAGSSVARKPVSPAPAYATHAIPAPWEDHGYDPYQSAAPALSEEELEIQRMEEEMAQVRLRKERLQNLQMLEEREEELKRSIAEKRNKG